MSRSVAIIGAGLSGTYAAYLLARRNWAVTLFDKSRGAGGRLAVRRTEWGSFTHGAPAVHGHTTEFQTLLEELARCGVARPALDGMVGPSPALGQCDYAAWQGQPYMNTIPKYLLAQSGASCHTSHHLTALQWCLNDRQWVLHFADHPSINGFDRVILTLPAPQVRALVEDSSTFNQDPLLTGASHQQLASIEMDPCWTLMVGFPDKLPLAHMKGFLPQEAISDQNPVAAVSNLSEKNSALAFDRWVVHADSAWSLAHLNQSRDVIADKFLADMMRTVSSSLPKPGFIKAHRWRYARVSAPANAAFMLGENGRLGLCGDGFAGPDGLWRDAEAALLSARSLVQTFKL